MTYYVYVLKTTNKSKLTTYVGYTKNLKKRLELHNTSKGAKFTRGRKWRLIYSESYKNKKDALSREYYIKKNKKFRNNIKKEYQKMIKRLN